MLYMDDEERVGRFASDDDVTRREFCSKIALTSAGALVAAATFAAAQSASGQQQQESAGGQQQQKTPALVYPAQKIEGAEALLPGSSLYFAYPTADEPAILVRTRAGQYYAYSQKCTHLGCSVYFDRARGSLECPCHKGAYDVQTGYMMYGPPPRPLDQISIQIRAGGEIWATGKRAGRREDFA